MDALAANDSHDEGPVSYIPSPELEALSDAKIEIEGRRLVLHSQVLATQSGVLRDVFLTREEAGQQGPLDLSLLFTGHTLHTVTLCLRWLYSPHLATHAALEMERASVLPVFRLAHKLGAEGLLRRISQYWAAKADAAEPGELLRLSRLAEACDLPDLRARCLALLAARLRAAGPAWFDDDEPGGCEAQLAGCGEEAVLDVLGSALEGGLAGAEMQQQPAEILELVEPPPGGGRFGFTWAVHAFSARAGAVCSPWVTVAGREWRLTAYPQGLNVGAGTHLAAFLWCNMAAARPQDSFSLDATMTILDQAPLSPDHLSSKLVDADAQYAPAASPSAAAGAAGSEHWGRTKLCELAELRRPDRRYLLNDRLLLRVEVAFVEEGDKPPRAPAFDPGSPELFYLPSFFHEPQLSDISATLGAVQLPLHTQVLAVRVGACLAAVTSGLELEGADARPAKYLAADALVRCCVGHAVHDVAAFLRLVYSPELAEADQLRALEPHLAPLLCLAHSSQTMWLKQAVADYAAGRCWRAPPRDLRAWAAATDACREPDTCALCLRALAQRLQGLGPSWEAGLPRGLLAADLRLAARLLRGLLAPCDPARGVVSVRDGAGGGVGGFTWVLSAFSTHPGEVSSPWVAVGGSEWRLDVYPRGNRNSNGDHLSVFLARNSSDGEAQQAEAAAFVEMRVLDQAAPWVSFGRVMVKPDVYTPTTRNWGQDKFMPLEELRRTDRSYLLGDRLLVTVEIRIVAPGAGSCN